MYARLILRIIEEKLGFMIFLRYGVVGLNCDGPEGTMIRRDSILKEQVINRVRERAC